MPKIVKDPFYFWWDYREEAPLYQPCESDIPLDQSVHLQINSEQGEFEFVGIFSYSVEEGLVFEGDVAVGKSDKAEWELLSQSINHIPSVPIRTQAIDLIGDWGRWTSKEANVRIVSPVTFNTSGRFQQRFRFQNNSLFWLNREIDSNPQYPWKWVTFGLYGFNFPTSFFSPDDDNVQERASKFGAPSLRTVPRLRLEGSGWKITVSPVLENVDNSLSCITHRGTLAYNMDMDGLESDVPQFLAIDAIETFLQFFSGRFCTVAHVSHPQWELFRRASPLIVPSPATTWGSCFFSNMSLPSKICEGVISIFRTRSKEQVDAFRNMLAVHGIGRTTYQDYLVADAIKSLEMLCLWLENEERISRGVELRKEMTLTPETAKKYFGSYLPDIFKKGGDWEDWADVVGKDAINFRNFTQHAGPLRGRIDPWSDLTLVWAYEIFDYVLAAVLLRETNQDAVLVTSDSQQRRRCPNCDRPEYRRSIRYNGKYCHVCVPSDVLDHLYSIER